MRLPFNLWLLSLERMGFAVRFALVLLPLLSFHTGAQVLFLTGALAYQSDSAGTDVGGAFEYDTFPGTPNSKFTINGGTDLALPLSVGTNSFSVSGASGTASPYFGIGFYFSNTASPFNGPFGAAPNLVALDHGAAGSSFAFAANGAQVSTFGQFSPLATYNGATDFTSGGYRVTISAFDYNSVTTSGTLQLSVAAVPEPATLASLGAGLLLLSVVRRGFRRS